MAERKWKIKKSIGPAGRGRRTRIPFFMRFLFFGWIKSNQVKFGHMESNRTGLAGGLARFQGGGPRLGMQHGLPGCHGFEFLTQSGQGGAAHCRRPLFTFPDPACRFDIHALIIAQAGADRKPSIGFQARFFLEELERRLPLKGKGLQWKKSRKS